MTPRSRNLLLSAAAVLAVVLIVVAVLVTTHSSKNGSASSASPTTTSSGAAPTTSDRSTATTGVGDAPTTTRAPTKGPAATTTTTVPIPLKVSVSATSGLHDGQAVTVTVSADAGSAFYGMDARLCAGGPAIASFYDYTPDPAGNCILHPLSADSDAYLEVPVAAPNQSGTLTFRVGVGTNRFTTENLTAAAITCGPGHPCQLVVRLQYPHGFGFRSFPLTYAG
jgi:hypothetical protein